MKNIACLFCFFACCACTSEMGDSSGTSGSNLSDATMIKYLQVFQELKAASSDVLELINENEPSAGQQAEFSSLQGIIENSGMNYEDFIAINNKIGTIYSISEANMGTYQNIADANAGQMDEMINSIQEMIDDPAVPASEKDRLRASLQEAKNGKDQLSNMFEQNKEKAAKMYKTIQKKLGKIASQAEVQLVNNYQQELKVAYDGISRPRIEGSL